ncbi:hypothetical protein EKG38_23360 [Shewanella canadensis]|uniref:Uncharacterized protein n=1 Tax=Shewanella canadensis TaxID=271096 RepID=A0A431WLZ3_9GAMM|nr:hypothetical protein [Shewanella canadensis]RTR36560.1 hypothetical protein EKG38_23360 [Shewanella canadensis]
MFSKFKDALPGMMTLRLINSFNEIASHSSSHNSNTHWQSLVDHGYNFLIFPSTSSRYEISSRYIDTVLSPRAFGAYVSLLVLNHWATKMYEMEDRRLSQYFSYHFHDSKRYLVDHCQELKIDAFEANLVIRLIE